MRIRRRDVPTLLVGVVTACASGVTPSARSTRGAHEEQHEMELEEDVIERELWKQLPQFLFDESLDAALNHVDRAIALRRTRQGASHPDLIWPLSMKIDFLSQKGMPQSLPAVVVIAEERLRLRRAALAAVPSELLASLDEILHLYTWGGEVHDERRVAELQREAAGLRTALEGTPSHEW